MWVKIQESGVPASIDYRDPGRLAKGAKLNLGHQFRRRNRSVAGRRGVLLCHVLPPRISPGSRRSKSSSRSLLELF
jgi:hypothetical protein